MSAKKRKRKYRIRWDRLIAQSLLLALIVFLCIWFTSLCSGETTAHETHETLTEAAEAGRRDAEKVLHTAPESMQRHEALMEIRAREHLLRSNGHAHAADDYIDAARKFLDNNGIR